MRLRDYFAAAALMGIMAGINDTERGGTVKTSAVAVAAYRTADAMLTEREKGQSVNETQGHL